MKSLAEQAVEYAERGWFIFPLGAKSKMPAIRKDKGGNGLKDATNDPTRIGKWWAKHPDHNIGLSVGPSGLYVVDVDGERGEESLLNLFKIHGQFPETLMAVTGKGFHHFFKMPREWDLGNTASKMGLGIDTRGHGGYVVLANSIHPDGGMYEWMNDFPVAELPEWILDKVKAPVWVAPTFTPSGYSINVHPYIRKVWEGVLADFQSAQAGTRNVALNNAAIKMGHWIAGGGIDRVRVEQELTLVAQQLGLGEEEIRKTLESGIQAGLLVPAYPPENKPFEHENIHQREARQSEGTVGIQRGSDFGRKTVEYLWNYRIPLGKLTILAGPSSVGKSYLTLMLAAHVTAGKVLLDDGPVGVDGEVLFCTYEDDVEDTIGPRADLLGVDMARCHFITGVTTEFGERQFGPADVPRIIDFLKARPELKLIVIDPLGSFIGAGSDVNSENEARAILGTLVKTAAETNTAIVMVAHFNKGSESPDPLHRIAGSQGISALPRSVLVVEWGENKERLVKHIKSSTSAEAATVGYMFDGTFKWTGIKRDERGCKDMVEKILKDYGKPMLVTDVYHRAEMYYQATETEVQTGFVALGPVIEGLGEEATWCLAEVNA